MRRARPAGPDRVCELDGCEVRFPPAPRNRRFCCETHRARAHVPGSLRQGPVADAPDRERRVCALPECGAEFSPTTWNGAYCCAPHRRRVGSRANAAKRRAAKSEALGRECRVCLVRDDEVIQWGLRSTVCAACDRRLQRTPACKKCGWEGGRVNGACPVCRPYGLLCITLIHPEDDRERVVYASASGSRLRELAIPWPLEAVVLATPKDWIKRR